MAGLLGGLAGQEAGPQRTSPHDCLPPARCRGRAIPAGGDSPLASNSLRDGVPGSVPGPSMGNTSWALQDIAGPEGLQFLHRQGPPPLTPALLSTSDRWGN